MSSFAVFCFSSSSLGPGSVVREKKQKAGWKCKKKPSSEASRAVDWEGERVTAAPLASPLSRVLSRLASLATRNGELARELLPLPSLPLCSLCSPIFFAFFAHYGAWSQTTLLDPPPLTFRGTSDGLRRKDTNRLPELQPFIYTPILPMPHKRC